MHLTQNYPSCSLMTALERLSIRWSAWFTLNFHKFYSNIFATSSFECPTRLVTSLQPFAQFKWRLFFFLSHHFPLFSSEINFLTWNYVFYDRWRLMILKIGCHQKILVSLARLRLRTNNTQNISVITGGCVFRWSRRSKGKILWWEICWKAAIDPEWQPHLPREL